MRRWRAIQEEEAVCGEIQRPEGPCYVQLGDASLWLKRRDKGGNEQGPDPTDLLNSGA